MIVTLASRALDSIVTTSPFQTEETTMKTIKEIIEALTPDQRKAVRNDLGDALDIVSEIVGDMPYSSLFNITCAVMEAL